MLRIWGHRQAPNVRKVIWAAAELGIAFEVIETGGPFGGIDAPDYRAMNPNGRIPTIDDDGFVLWESHAILRYLANKSRDGALYPQEARARARVDQWLDWQGAHQAQAVRDLVKMTIKAKDVPDPARLAAAEAEADLLFGILDGALANGEYIAGDSFTIADIPLAVGYRRWATLPIMRKAFPALESWFNRVGTRPAFAESTPHSAASASTPLVCRRNSLGETARCWMKKRVKLLCAQNPSSSASSTNGRSVVLSQRVASFIRK